MKAYSYADSYSFDEELPCVGRMFCSKIDALHLPAAFQCVLQRDIARLETLPLEELSIELQSKRHPMNVLHYAAALGEVGTLRLLIARLTPRLVQDAHGFLSQTVLCCCDGRFQFSDPTEVLKLLLEHFPVSERGLDDVICPAAGTGCSQLLEYIKSLKGDDGTPRVKNWSKHEKALAKAAEHGKTDCARLLLDLGVDARAIDYGPADSGWTALMLASQNGHTDCVRLLLEHGADVHFYADYGENALTFASSNGFTDCVRLLLEHGADANSSTYDGTTLMFASGDGHTDIVRMLLEHGANANATTNRFPYEPSSSNSDTALMSAARWGSLDCMRLLLDHHAIVNAVGYQGKTALMLASERGHADCLRLLLDHRASANPVNDKGKTALMLASEKGHAECVSLLQKEVAIDRGASRRAFAC